MVVVCSSTPAAATLPNYLESAVFFEHYPNTYGEPENLQLMPQGQILLDPLGIESIVDFDWSAHTRKDPSWWNRIENFFYLAPLLADGDRDHRRLANEWFESWYRVHEDAKPNPGAWDGMTVGQRVMILTWMLKLESTDPIAGDLAGRIEAAIGWHQTFLLDPQNYEGSSNHGMWQSLGLLESTRVVPNEAAEMLALDRMLTLAQKSISKKGMHVEHSPGYHFTFAQWLGEFVPYLESICAAESPAVAALRTCLNHMSNASYYLYDHDERVPPIGDSSATQIPADYGRVSSRPVFVDREAGFAVFKDPAGSAYARYIVFNIQNQSNPPKIPFHYHDDALGIYYADRGESILDDAGRYSYRDSGRRRFVRSAAAHNTILEIGAGQAVHGKSGELTLADEVLTSEDGGQYRFTAAMFQRRATRSITVDRDSAGVTVHDAFEAPRDGHDFVTLWTLGRDVSSVDKTGPASWLLHMVSGRVFELEISDSRGDSLPQVEVVVARQQPLLGWRAEGFQQLVPATTLVTRVSHATEIITTIRPAD